MAQPVCAIVGAGPGIGHALAARFGREGFAIALVGRRPEPLARLIETLADHGIEALPFRADAGDAASLVEGMDEVRTALGPPQVLIYNAFAGHPGLPSTLSPGDLAADLRVNVLGALVAAQAVIPKMRAAGLGTILFTGGGYAFDPAAEQASLGVGKAALRNLAFSLAKEVGPDGIHVATVTIAGLVRPGTGFDPLRIAEAFWALHVQARSGWEREIVFRG